MSVRELKDGRWVVEWKEGRSGRKRYFGRGLEAERRARDYDATLGLRQTRPRREHDGYLVFEILAEYLAYRRFGPRSISPVRACLGHLLASLGNVPAIRLTDAHIDEYVSQRSEVVRDTTIRRELTLLHAALNWAAKRRPPLLPLNPVHGYRITTTAPQIITPPTPDELAAILRVASEHLRRAILLSYYLGLRPGAVELLSLRWQNVSLQDGTILVRSAHKGGPAHRLVPIHPELALQLPSWQDGHAHLVHWAGRPVRTIDKAWRRTLRKAGITRRIRMYDIRHAFVTATLAGGLPIKAVAEIVGSDPQTLMRSYQHVTQHLHRTVVAAVPAVVAQIPTDARLVRRLKLIKK